MRMRRWLLLGLVAALPLGGALRAQMPGPEVVSALAPLERGSLTIWIVTPGTAAERARSAALRRAAGAPTLPTTLQQQTSGSFGQTAGSVGTTAGSYGTAAGSYGQTASSTGQTAGSYGASASDVGTASSNVGTTAGNYGQTAGSFGTASSNAGQAAGSYSGGVGGAGRGALAVALTREHQGLALNLRSAFQHADVRVVDVLADDLHDKLAAAAGTVDYPDVVAGDALPSWWDGSGVGLAMLGLPNLLDAPRPEGSDGREDAWMFRRGRVVVTADAPHPERARAFVVWLRGGRGCEDCERKPLPKEALAPAQVALVAVRRLLQGEALGADADEAAAEFSGGLAYGLALTPPANGAVGGLEYRQDVMSAVANDRLGVVVVRTIASSDLAFGVMESRVVLRRGVGGRWRVLQITGNVEGGSSRQGTDLLRAYARDLSPAKVVGVSLASPPDGDNRQAQPELWWDNGGGAGLLVVEWQMTLGTGWTDSRLMPVTDTDPRTQTRVTAAFARRMGVYRWRVWAVGTGGVMVISPWRRLNIVP